MKQPDDSTCNALPMPADPRHHENPEALAKHAIRVLETYLRDTHQLTVAMGAELEFGVLHKTLGHASAFSNRYHNRDLYGVQRAALAKKGNYSSSVFRYEKQRDTWFPESRRVSYSYREESRDDQWDALEVVLTHRPTDEQGNPLANDGCTLARSIAALRHQLHEPTPGYLPIFTGIRSQEENETPQGKAARKVRSPSRINADYWRHFTKNELMELRTEALIPGTHISNGMHINTSFMHTETGAHTMAQDMRIIPMLKKTISALFHENFYLVSSGQASLHRFQAHQSEHINAGPIDFDSYVVEKTNAHYIENAICDASANPYYAIMLQLAGMAAGMDQLSGKNQVIAGKAITSYHVPSLEAVKQDCLNGQKLRATLNRCEANLGDRFITAIKHTPPQQAPDYTHERCR